jgi:hypothetical protein
MSLILGILDSGVAASTNSYESIATVTVGSGGASEVEFTSIPSTYTHLQIRALARNTTAEQQVIHLVDLIAILATIIQRIGLLEMAQALRQTMLYLGMSI